MGSGASLATVSDQGVNDWLMGKAAEWIHPSDTVVLQKLQLDIIFFMKHELWIGIYGDVDYQGGVQTLNYKWASGEPVIYTNW